jgi:hypothetical protein
MDFRLDVAFAGLLDQRRRLVERDKAFVVAATGR